MRWRGAYLFDVLAPKRKSGTQELLRTWRRTHKLFDPELIVPNGVTDLGINDNENVYFAGSTQRSPWYFGLIDNAGFTALASGDTSASHAGWTEFTTIVEANRQAWSVGAAAAKTITGTASSVFTMAGAANIKGAFLISNNTLGGSTGMLWSTGAFGVVQALVTSQALRVNYTLTGASS
jgi:hypothetical protein